jgi:hypothetical protein
MKAIKTLPSTMRFSIARVRCSMAITDWVLDGFFHPFSAKVEFRHIRIQAVRHRLLHVADYILRDILRTFRRLKQMRERYDESSGIHAYRRSPGRFSVE